MCCALCIGKALAIADNCLRLISASTVSTWFSKRGRNVPPDFFQPMQLDAQVGGQDLKVVQPLQGLASWSVRSVPLCWLFIAIVNLSFFISSYFLYALILGKNTCRYKTRPSCRFNLSMQIETAGRKIRGGECPTAYNIVRLTRLPSPWKIL